MIATMTSIATIAPRTKLSKVETTLEPAGTAGGFFTRRSLQRDPSCRDINPRLGLRVIARKNYEVPGVPGERTMPKDQVVDCQGPPLTHVKFSVLKLAVLRFSLISRCTHRAHAAF